PRGCRSTGSGTGGARSRRDRAAASRPHSAPAVGVLSRTDRVAAATPRLILPGHFGYRRPHTVWNRFRDAARVAGGPMRISTIAIVGLAASLAAQTAWAQAATDCQPSRLNVAEARYPCIHPDNRVTFRVNAPDAQSVRVNIGGGFDLVKGPDGIWDVTTTPLVIGFHYYSLRIDGATLADPATMTFFGSGWQNSALEVPDPDGAFYAQRDVPRGKVAQQWYHSKVTGQWRRAYVYTPPGYDSNRNTRYPVLYLLHGWG